MGEQSPPISHQSVLQRFNHAVTELESLYGKIGGEHLIAAQSLFVATPKGIYDLKENLELRLQCAECALRLKQAMEPAQDRSQDISKSKTLLDASERVSKAMKDYERQKSLGGLSTPIQYLTRVLLKALDTNE